MAGQDLKMTMPKPLGVDDGSGVSNTGEVNLFAERGGASKKVRAPLVS
jgi:hypothetical protein